MQFGDDVVRKVHTTRAGFVLVSLYSWMTMTWGVLLARFIRGLLVHKIRFGTDDATALIGHILYLGTVVAWQYAVNGGLGKKLQELSANDTALFSKALFSVQIIEVFTMTLAKSSSALLIERVAPQPRKVKAGLFAMIIFYCVFSSLTISFRCGIPSQWSTRAQNCGNSGLLIAGIALNLTTDLVLAAWLFPTLMSISLDTEKRYTAMVLFGSRSVVSLIAGVQIWSVVKAFSGNDPTRDIVDFAVLSQSVTSLSLIAANIPRVKRILGVGGSGIVYPDISASELTANRSRQYSVDNGLKLVPTGSGRFTTTVTSDGSRDKKKAKAPAEWQGQVNLGSKEDEHTSTSSLFDQTDRDGVTLERDFQLVVEERRTLRRNR